MKTNAKYFKFYVKKIKTENLLTKKLLIRRYFPLKITQFNNGNKFNFKIK